MMEARESDVELSSDDEDFKPEEEQPSEDEPSDENDEKDSDEEQQTSTRTRRGRGKVQNTPTTAPKTQETPALDPESEKARIDALWSDFLSDTNTPVDERKEETQTTSTVLKSSSSTSKTEKEMKKQTEDLFGGLEESVEESNDNSVNEKKETTGTSNVLKRPVSNLSAMLSQLQKKPKLNVLEKTKSDWDGYKQAEGISEELKTYNRGRNG